MALCKNCGKEVLEVTDTFTIEMGPQVLTVKNVPIKKCGCETVFSMRAGLIMEYFSKYEQTAETSVDFADLEKKYENKSNMELIDPNKKLELN